MTWSPDRQSLMFVSNRAGSQDLWIKRADLTGTAELVLDRAAPIWEGVRSSDGTWVVFREGANQEADIYAIRPGVDSVPRAMATMDAQEWTISLSPNGRWLAYASDHSGQSEVYVRSFPEAGTLVQVSEDRGTAPVWSDSGGELFYQNGAHELVAVQVSTDPFFEVRTQEVLFSMEGYMLAEGHPTYAVTPDARRFVMLRMPGDSGSELILVDNWFTELRERMGGN